MEKEPGQRKVYEKAIKNWPEDERPREKLLRQGEHALSNTELLAILLRTGVKGESAIDLARKIIKKFKTFRNMSHTDITQWKEFKGLGEAKLCQIKAAIEMARRFMTEERKPEGKVKSSKEVADLMMPRMRDLKKEVFKILLLDGQNNIMDMKGTEIDEGTAGRANAYPSEVMAAVFRNFAASVILVHNHPGGNPEPSDNDKKLTRNILIAAKSLSIEFLDHIIIGDNIYYSFADEGLLQSYAQTFKYLVSKEL